MEKQCGSRLCLIIFFSFLVLLLTIDFYNRTRSAVSLKQIQQTLDSDSVWVQRAKKIGKMAGIELTPDTIEELSGSVGKTVGLFLYKQISSAASNLFSLLVTSS